MGRKKIAFFDFDGTLTRKDSFIEFAVLSVGRFGLVKALAKNFFSLAGWKLGLIPNWKAKQKLFASLYAGMTSGRFDKHCEAMADHIDGILRPDIVALLDRHLENGDAVYIVSASVDKWIRPWAMRRGVTGVIGTEIETDENGRLTGQFSTRNCYGEEKTRRIREVMPEVDQCEIWAYGDSAGDRPMLEMAQHPVAV